jgi:hypothetical protein
MTRCADRRSESLSWSTGSALLVHVRALGLRPRAVALRAVVLPRRKPNKHERLPVRTDLERTALLVTAHRNPPRHDGAKRGKELRVMSPDKAASLPPVLVALVFAFAGLRGHILVHLGSGGVVLTPAQIVASSRLPSLAAAAVVVDDAAAPMAGRRRRRRRQRRRRRGRLDESDWDDALLELGDDQ